MDCHPPPRSWSLLLGPECLTSVVCYLLTEMKCDFFLACPRLVRPLPSRADATIRPVGNSFQARVAHAYQGISPTARVKVVWSGHIFLGVIIITKSSGSAASRHTKRQDCACGCFGLQRIRPPWTRAIKDTHDARQMVARHLVCSPLPRHLLGGQAVFFYFFLFACTLAETSYEYVPGFAGLEHGRGTCD